MDALIVGVLVFIAIQVTAIRFDKWKESEGK